MRILITGATGFVGTAFLKALAGGKHKLYALCRSERSKTLVADRAEALHGDLQDAGTLQKAFEEATPDIVIHLAAQIASTRDSGLIDRVNALGTETLLDTAIKAGTRRFVFTSTVVTGQADGKVLREDEPLPVHTPYGRSKQHSERLLLEHAKKGDIETVILRPSHVYGGGGWFENIVRDVRKRRFAIPGDGENLWDMVHVDDLAHALVLATSSESPGPLYHVVDDTPISLNDFIGLIADASKRPMPWHVPIWLARLVAGRNAIDAVVRSARSCNKLIRKDLGWSPRYPDCRQTVPDVVRSILASAQQ